MYYQQKKSEVKVNYSGIALFIVGALIICAGIMIIIYFTAP